MAALLDVSALGEPVTENINRDGTDLQFSPRRHYELGRYAKICVRLGAGVHENHLLPMLWPFQVYQLAIKRGFSDYTLLLSR